MVIYKNPQIAPCPHFSLGALGDFADDIFKCIYLNENMQFFIKISLKFVPNGPVDNISALV